MWKKIGLIFNAANQYDWMVSHAANPVALNLGGNIYRIYFSTRNIEKRSCVAYLDIDITDPLNVLSLSSEPILRPGPPGTFYDKGVSVGSAINCASGEQRIYFVGWNIPEDRPFRNQIGVASKAPSEESFTASSAPVLALNETDPLTMSYPWVLEEAGIFKMWYGSHISWANKDFEMLHVLRYAESDDGLVWRRSDKEILPLKKTDGEFAMSRPCVIQEKGIYRMWFSYRAPLYAIGYAESPDGKEWTRMDDKAILTRSAFGFDSKSVEYASVFRHSEELFILYNGNNYGETGFGIAAWA